MVKFRHHKRPARPARPARLILQVYPEMSLPQELVRKIERLARLQLSDEQREMYGSQLNQIFDYIDRLNKLDTSEVEKRGIQYPHHLQTRPDEIVPQETTREDLLNCSQQEVIGDQIAIKNIMK